MEEKLNHLEQSSGALADDLANKSALIQFCCMEGRHGQDGRQKTGRRQDRSRRSVAAPEPHWSQAGVWKGVLTLSCGCVLHHLDSM